mmetsp:Transcript_13670/g.20812  ORF Transcript_13670/g.20812 Transcript_13670/m.20812 type:complete len:319 (+) Transcript_13670:83-1039(+)
MTISKSSLQRLLFLFWIHRNVVAFRPKQYATLIRGGSTYPDNNSNTNNDNADAYNYQSPQQDQQGGNYYPQQPADNGQEFFYNTPQQTPQEYEEYYNPQQQQGDAFQDRIDTWKQEQMQQQEKFRQVADAVKEGGGSPEQLYEAMKQNNPLMAQVGRGARSGIFFMFVWRNIHFYQLAEEYFAKKGGGLKRLFVTLNLMILFLLNISGFVSSFTGRDGSTTHTQKKRLKAVLNIDKLIELSFLVVGLIRLTLFPQSRDQSEIMLASIIHHVFFALTVHTYTKLNWDDHKSQSPIIQQNNDDDYYYDEQNYNDFQPNSQ